MHIGNWFALLEIPFLATCVVFAFLNARSLKGGQFGRGMSLLAWGFLIMGVGHLHMQLVKLAGFDLFGQLFGESGGQVVWMAALMLTWFFSAAGFILIYRASKL